MAKGRTISITIPEPLYEFYTNQAEELDTSRSKLILNVLIDDWKKNKEALAPSVQSKQSHNEDCE